MADIHQLFDGLIQRPLNNQIATPQASDYCDETLARRFTARHQDDLRFVNTWGRWLVWDGMRWRLDETLLVIDHVRSLVRDAANEILEANGSQKLATGVASSKTVSAIERLARADRQHAAKTGDWDTDPWLLNTPDGTVDLRTGQLRPHNRRDRITKMTAVGPGGECPLWLSFLNRIFNGDQNLIAYIQRVFGYALTGSIQEHALFFCYGTGANRKKRVTKHPAQHSGRLFGGRAYGHVHRDAERAPSNRTGDATRGPCRYCTGNRRWSAMGRGQNQDADWWRSSQRPIYAPRLLYVSAEIAIAGNHKPGLRNVDEAIKRRINMVPFKVTIPVDERDLQLAEKLRAEWRGILSWGIRGCLEWQRIGLAPPPAVIEATATYLAEQDAVGRFISERCERHPEALEEVQALYREWKRFCEASGEPVTSQKSFNEKLENGNGLIKGNHPRSRRACFKGIKLRPRDDAPGMWLDSSMAT